MVSRAARNIPCAACRASHVSCRWENDSEICVKCAEYDIDCSGPSRRTRPACHSCRKVKARCKWDEDDSCQRCTRLKRECVSEESSTASSSTSSSGGSLSPALRSETYRQSERDLFTSPMKDFLVKQGLARLHALDCGLQDEWNGILSGRGLLVQELLNLLACDSCLKYTGSVLGADRNVDFRPLEEITNKQWLAGPLDKATYQHAGIRTLWYRAWSIIPKIPSISKPDRHTLKQILTAIRLAWKLGLDEMGNPELAQCILGFVVLKAVPEFEQEWDDSENKARHAGSALQLALHESELAIIHGQPSYISEINFRLLLALKTGPLSPTPPDLCFLTGITAHNSKEVTSTLRDLYLTRLFDNIHLQTRQLAECHSESLKSLNALSFHWKATEDLLARLDSLTMTVTVYNSYTEPNDDSQAVLDVLRSIGRVELCLLQNVVLSLVVARRLTASLGEDECSTSKMAEWTGTVVQRMLRIVDMVMTHECPISQIYGVLEVVARIMKFGSDFLLPVIKSLDASPQQIVASAIKTSAFWDCGSKQMAAAW